MGNVLDNFKSSGKGRSWRQRLRNIVSGMAILKIIVLIKSLVMLYTSQLSELLKSLAAFIKSSGPVHQWSTFHLKLTPKIFFKKTIPPGTTIDFPIFCLISRALFTKIHWTCWVLFHSFWWVLKVIFDNYPLSFTFVMTILPYT